MTIIDPLSPEATRFRMLRQYQQSDPMSVGKRYLIGLAVIVLGLISLRYIDTVLTIAHHVALTIGVATLGLFAFAFAMFIWRRVRPSPNLDTQKKHKFADRRGNGWH